jgi:hypothetical protein
MDTQAPISNVIWYDGGGGGGGDDDDTCHQPPLLVDNLNRMHLHLGSVCARVAHGSDRAFSMHLPEGADERRIQPTMSVLFDTPSHYALEIMIYRHLQTNALLTRFFPDAQCRSEFDHASVTMYLWQHTIFTRSCDAVGHGQKALVDQR